LILFFREQIGEPVIFQWVEKVREFLQTYQNADPEPNSKQEQEKNLEENPHMEAGTVPLMHGDPLAAGKCTFQGHVAIVLNIGQVK